MHNGSSSSKVMGEIDVTNIQKIPNNSGPKQGKMFIFLV
jgi:hypothetical protein